MKKYRLLKKIDLSVESFISTDVIYFPDYITFKNETAIITCTTTISSVEIIITIIIIIYINIIIIIVWFIVSFV